LLGGGALPRNTRGAGRAVEEKFAKCFQTSPNKGPSPKRRKERQGTHGASKGTMAT